LQRSTRLDKGFTLLELLLAVGISAFVLVVSYSFFNFIEKAGRSASENAELQSFIPSIFYLFLRDFNSINTSYGSPQLVRDTDGNVRWLEFFTENCYYFKGVCRVKYWLYKNERENWLIRSEYRINSETSGIDFPVTSRVKEFEVYRLSGGDWVKGVDTNLLKIVLKLNKGGELPLVFKIRS
jgi:prepilin-type N-terminal cleavage/methylation domain-containing protein